MNQRTFFARVASAGFIALSLLIASSSLVQAINRQSRRPPYAVDAPLTEPRLFAEGVISTIDDEFGGTFTLDGNTCYFNRSVPRSYFYAICVSHFAHGKWSTPEIASFSGRYRDADPMLSPDGTKLLFASDRPVHGEEKHDYDIWMVEKTSTGWSEPKHLEAPINSDYNEYFASIAANGTIYFSSNRPGAKGGEGDADIYRSRLVDGKYSEAEHLSEAVNSAAFELDCVIAPDDSFLLIGVYGRPDGYGNYDIYISNNVNGNWTPAQNLGPKINTSARDYSPRISPDGKYFFFTSERDFATVPLTSPLTYQALLKGLHSTQNGSGNIYQIDLSVIRAGTSPDRR